MGQCIGNCIKCTLVPDEDKITCCSFQTLKQSIEIRTQLRQLTEIVNKIESSSVYTQAIEEITDAEPPAAQDNQEPQIKKAKK